MGFSPLSNLHPRDVAAYQNNDVIFDDDFSDGLQGWSGLRNTGINHYPSLHPYAAGGRQAMALDVSDGLANRTATASKRASVRSERYRWHSRCGWTSDTGATGLRYMRWAIDNEDADNRWWAEVRYQNFDEATGEVAPKWEVTVGPVGGDLEHTQIDFDYELGYNQKNKVDFFDLTLEVDFRGSTKRYRSLTVNDASIDLSDYAITHGSKLDPPGTYFTNGQNWLFWCENRTNNGNTRPTMFIDRTRAEVLT